MKTIYVSFDGVVFEDSYECEMHEWIQSHQQLKEILCFDSEGEPLLLDFSDKFYNDVYQVVIPTKQHLEQMKDFCEITGFICLLDITHPGIWEFSNGNFICETIFNYRA